MIKQASLIFRNYKILFLLIFIIVLFNTQTAFAQSFDCAKASTDVEKLICSDDGFKKQDEQLSILYENSIKAAKKEYSHLIVDSQRSWLKRRSACSDSRDCISQLYKERILWFEENGDKYLYSLLEGEYTNINFKYQNNHTTFSGSHDSWCFNIFKAIENKKFMHIKPIVESNLSNARRHLDSCYNILDNPIYVGDCERSDGNMYCKQLTGEITNVRIYRVNFDDNPMNGNELIVVAEMKVDLTSSAINSNKFAVISDEYNDYLPGTITASDVKSLILGTRIIVISSYNNCLDNPIPSNIFSKNVINEKLISSSIQDIYVYDQGYYELYNKGKEYINIASGNNYCWYGK